MVRDNIHLVVVGPDTRVSDSAGVYARPIAPSISSVYRLRLPLCMPTPSALSSHRLFPTNAKTHLKMCVTIERRMIWFLAAQSCPTTASSECVFWTTSILHCTRECCYTAFRSLCGTRTCPATIPLRSTMRGMCRWHVTLVLERAHLFRRVQSTDYRRCTKLVWMRTNKFVDMPVWYAISQIVYCILESLEVSCPLVWIIRERHNEPAVMNICIQNTYDWNLKG
jgi:hypothetical protein